MNAGVARRGAHSHAALPALLRLARGLPLAPGAVDWDAALTWARQERLLALAWHRAGDTIRREAPAPMAAQWRAEVLRGIDRGDAQHRSLEEALLALAAAGIEVIVLKGAPLAQRLYGDRNARPSLDVDLWVAESDRRAARRILESLGWTLIGGSSPWEESFRRVLDGHQLLLEVHSRLLDAPELWALGMPAPDHSPVVVDAVQMRAHDGPLLPACMAAHLAKHSNAPLLWVNDFATLWALLDAGNRGASENAARKVGLLRHLRWAVRRGEWLDTAAGGDVAALERLGYRRGGRREAHTLLRLAWLASTPRDAVGVIGGRLWPPYLRGDGRGFVRQAIERLIRRGRRRRPAPAAVGGAGVARPGDRGAEVPLPGGIDAPAARALDVGREEFAVLLGDLVRADGATWIRARGGSMEPTIPHATLVHLVAAPPRALQPGEVVLARMPNGSYALHRVLWEREGRVGLKGDAVPVADIPVPRDAVLAVADMLEIRGRIRSVPPAPTVMGRYLSAFVRRARRRLGSRRGAPFEARSA